MEIKVIRSKRRRKSSSAKIKGKFLEIRVPFWLPEYKVKEISDYFLSKVKKRNRKTSNEYLLKKAQNLNRKYLGNKAKNFSVIWSNRLKSTFGVCDIAKREIRITSRLKRTPIWVIDYLLVHEMAHLLVTGHSKKFWQLVNQYPKADLSKAFLKGVIFAEKRL